METGAGKVSWTSVPPNNIVVLAGYIENPVVLEPTPQLFPEAALFFTTSAWPSFGLKCILLECCRMWRQTAVQRSRPSPNHFLSVNRFSFFLMFVPFELPQFVFPFSVFVSSSLFLFRHSLHIIVLCGSLFCYLRRSTIRFCRLPASLFGFPFS